MRKGLGFLLLFFSLFIASADNLQPTPVNQAFLFSATMNGQILSLDWQIAPGYQLYRDKFSVNSSDLQLGTLNLPAGTPRHDTLLGDYQTYEDLVHLTIPINQSQPGNYQITVSYQGCSEGGYCYPPQTRALNIQVSALGIALQSISTVDAVPTLINHVEAPATTTTPFWLLLLTFFGFGLLLSFTPCVLPMIPILSGIIIGHKRSTRHAFVLSFTYVTAMALAYAGTGLLAGLLGKNLQAALQAPWILILFSAVFVALACSLFGLFDLRLPSKWHTQITAWSNRHPSGSYVGVAVMGVLSILIVSPCVSAPLVAALLYISQSDHAALGGVLLLAMGFGMGTPLLLIAVLENRFLPSSGLWMQRVKECFGVLLLLTAVWLLYRLIPANICLILFGVILIGAAIYWAGLEFGYSVSKHAVNPCCAMHSTQRLQDRPAASMPSAFDGKMHCIFCSVSPLEARIRLPWLIRFFNTTPKLQKISRPKSLIWLILLCFIFASGGVFLVGGLLGHTDPLHPWRATQRLPVDKIIVISTPAELDFALANAHGKKVLLDYYAEWCVSCKILDNTVFNQADVQTALQNVVVLKVDVTRNDANSQQLEQRFNVFAPPTLIFLDANGQEIPNTRIVGEVSKQKFLQKLDSQAPLT